MKGIPTYTLHSVAWPSLPLGGRPRVTEELSISFEAKGGGSHASFNLRWYDLGRTMGRTEPPSVAVECFSDGLGALLDQRVSRLLRRMQMHRKDDGSPQPDRVVEWLEELGVGPSTYHLRGLVEAGLTPAERDDVERRMKRLLAHERGE